MAIRLTRSLSAWGRPDFETILKREVRGLKASVLPLQQGLTRSSYAGDEIEEVVVLGVLAEQASIRVKAGIFYTGTTPGCSCVDDPTPLDQVTEYCELLFRIDRETAIASVTLLA